MKAIVTEKHRNAIKEFWEARVPAFYDMSDPIYAEELAENLGLESLAKSFPDPQPTTERPTEPGAYWFRKVFTEEWKLTTLISFGPNGLLAHVSGEPSIWVQDTPDGEWLRIDPPASCDVKGESNLLSPFGKDGDDEINEALDALKIRNG